MPTTFRPTILVTGCAGFIGYHTAARLVREGHRVTGVDNLGGAGEPSLQLARLALLEGRSGFDFLRMDVADAPALQDLLEVVRPESVIHLAARAGVRTSAADPRPFTDANLLGFFNVLDGCARLGVRHLVYASSSSVYGASGSIPFSEADPADQPLSYYAATKKANELMAHAYARVHGLPSSGLRFFTVYGPWGRPDMAPLLFGRAILRGQPIRLFNRGRMKRDFTYVDDVVEALVRVLARPPGAGGEPPCRVLNVGNSTPAELVDFVETLERVIGQRARRVEVPMQAGDVLETWADTRRLEALTGFVPRTPLEEGLRHMVAWLRAYDGEEEAQGAEEDLCGRSATTPGDAATLALG